MSTSGYSTRVAYASSSRYISSFIGGLVGRVEDGGFAYGLHSIPVDRSVDAVGAVMNVSTTMASSAVVSHNLVLGGLVGEITTTAMLHASYTEQSTINLVDNEVSGGSAVLGVRMGGILGNDLSDVKSNSLENTLGLNTNAYKATVNANLYGGNYSTLMFGGTYGYLNGDYNSNTANTVNVNIVNNTDDLYIYAGGLAGNAEYLSSSYTGLNKASVPLPTTGNNANGLNMLGNVKVSNTGNSVARTFLGGVFGCAANTTSGVTMFNNIEKDTYQANTDAVLTAEGNVHSYVGGLVGIGDLSANNVHLTNIEINSNGTSTTDGADNIAGGFVGEWTSSSARAVQNSSVILDFNQTGSRSGHTNLGGVGNIWGNANTNLTISNIDVTFDGVINSQSTSIENIGGLLGYVNGASSSGKLTITGNNVNRGFTVTSNAPEANIGYAIGMLKNLTNGLIDVGTTNSTLTVNFNHSGTLNVGGTIGSVNSSTFAVSKSTNVNLNIMAYANGGSTATNAVNALRIGGVIGQASGSSSNVYLGYNYVSSSSSYTGVTSGITFDNDIILGVQEGKSYFYLGGMVGRVDHNINVNKVTTAGEVDLKKATCTRNWLFGWTYTRTTTNAVFYDSGSYIGGVAGFLANTNSPSVNLQNNTINNRSFDVTATYVGGAVGYASGRLTTGSGSSSSTQFVNKGNITTSGIYAGGIVGRDYCNSYHVSFFAKNEGNITSTYSDNAYAGGYVGNSNYTTLYSFTNSGKISSATHAGGVIGYAESGINPKLYSCTNSGMVEVTTSDTAKTVYAGGLIGYCGTTAWIYGCTNTGAITRETTDTAESHIGGFIGRTYAVNITVRNGVKSTSSGSIQNNSTSVSSSSGKLVGYSLAGVKIQQTNISGSVNAYYNVGGAVGKLTGSDSNISNGVISTTTVSATSGQAGGVIGTYSASGQVEIGWVEVGGSVSGYYAGGVIGSVTDGNVDFISGDYTKVTASVSNKTGGYYAGGAIGQLIGDAYVEFPDGANDVFINRGSVTGVLAAGGFIGYSNTSYSQQVLPSSVVNEGTIGSTTGTAVAGGIIGLVNAGKYLIKAKNQGAVTSKTQAGGIIGLVNAGTITLETAINTGKITQAATSGINSTLPYSAGGIVGLVAGGTVNVYNCLNGMSATGAIIGGEITTLMFNTSGTYYTANTTAAIHLGGIIGYVKGASVTIDNHRSYMSDGDTTKEDGLTCMTKNYGKVNNYANNSGISSGGIVGYIDDPLAPSGKGLKAQNHGRIFALNGCASGLVARLNAQTNFSTSNRFAIWSSATGNYGDVYSHSSKALLENGTEAGGSFRYLHTDGTSLYYYGGSASGIVSSVLGYLLIEGVSNGVREIDATYIYGLNATAGYISTINPSADVMFTYYGTNWAKVESGWSNAGGFIATLHGTVTFAEATSFYVNKGTLQDEYFAGGVISYCLHTSTAILNNVINEGSITGYDYKTYSVAGGAGGIVAFAAGSVTLNNCQNKGAVTGGNAGGLIGQNVVDGAHINSSQMVGLGEITITDSSNSGTVTTVNACAGGAGGLVGYVQTTSGDGSVAITDCENTGTVTAPEKAGGAVGWVAGTTAITRFTHRGDGASVLASGYTGRGNYTTGSAGGVVGYHSSGALAIDAVDINAEVRSYGGSQSGYSGSGGVIGVDQAGGSTLTLGDGISVSATIGGIDSSTIVNSAGGLVGRLASIGSSLRIASEFNFTGTIEHAASAGGAIGRLYSGTTDIYGSNMSIEGNINGYYRAGGAVGMLAAGTLRITKLKNSATITASVSSGIDGIDKESTGAAGGIIGTINSDGIVDRQATLTGCSNAGTVTAPIFAGGAVGLTYYPVTINGFTTTTASIIKATGGSVTLSGTVYSGTGSAGGLIGISQGAVTIQPNISIAGKVFSAGASSVKWSGAGGLIGSTCSTVTFDSSIDAATDITVSATIGGESTTSLVSEAGGLFGRIHSTNTYTINYANITGTIQNASLGAGGLIGRSVTGASIVFEETGTSLTSTNIRNTCVVKAAGANSAAGGYIGAFGSNASNVGTIKFVNCITTAKSIQSPANVGGFVGALRLGSSGSVFQFATNCVDLTSNAQNMGGLIGQANINDGAATLSIFGALTDVNIGNSRTSFGESAGGAIGLLLNTGTVSITGHYTGSGSEFTFINNITSDGTANIYGQYSGGVVGMYDPAANAQLTIRHEQIGSYANIYGNNAAGGIIGFINDTTSQNARANAPVVNSLGNVTTEASSISLNGTSTAFIKATIAGTSYAGGVVGRIQDAPYVIINLESVQSTLNGRNVGGFVGIANGTHLVFRNSRVSNTTITSSTDLGVAGGFVGIAGGQVYINKTGNETTTTISGDIAGGYIGRVNAGGTAYIGGNSSAAIANNSAVSGLTVGGFIGSVKGIAAISYCVNNAIVTATGKTIDGTVYGGNAGGFVGAATGFNTPSSETNFVSLVYCTNNATITSTQYAGGMISQFYGISSVVNYCKMQVVNCLNSGSISGTGDADVGGIIGIIISGYVLFGTDTQNNGAVSSTSGGAGGVVGSMQGNSYVGIYGTSSTANVSGVRVGGYVGYNYCARLAASDLDYVGTLTVVSSSTLTPAGGSILGWGYSTTTSNTYFSNITESVNTIARTSAYGSLGGFIGRLENMYSIISDSTSSGALTGTSSCSNVGGIVGYVSNSTVISYRTTNESTITGVTYAGGFIGYADGTADLNLGSSGDDVSNNTGAVIGLYAGGFVGYSAAAKISIYGDNSGAITVTGAQYAGGFVGMNQIASGTGTLRITGTNTGVISGTGHLGGIIGYVSYTNVTLSEVHNQAPSITSNTSSKYVGGLIACSVYGSLRASNSSNSCAITGTYYTGGLIGYSLYTTANISESSNTGAVRATSSRAGGFIGMAYGNVTIESSSNTSKVQASSYAGGFIGANASTSNYTSTFTSCTNDALVIGGSYAGGLIGYTTANLTVSSCVIGSGSSETENSITGTSYAGGVLGYISSTSRTLSIKDTTNYQSIRGNFRAGGLIGSCTILNFTIESCNNYGSIIIDDTNTTSTSRYIGGLVGYLAIGSSGSGSASILSSNNHSYIGISITTSSVYAGGLIGALALNANMTITSSDNYSSVDTNFIYGSYTAYTSYAGGLIGASTGGSYTLTLSSSGITTSDDAYVNVYGEYAGGFIGSNTTIVRIEGSSQQGNAYSSVTGKYAGGVIGYHSNSKTSNYIEHSNYFGVRGIAKRTSSSGYASAAYNQAYAGGYVGYLYGYMYFYSADRHNSVSVGNGGCAGGLVGYASSATIKVGYTWIYGDIGHWNPHSDYDFSDITYYAGGFFGYLSGCTVTTTTSSLRFVGNVYGEESSGGFVGYSLNSSITVSGALTIAAQIGYDGAYFIEGVASLLGQFDGGSASFGAITFNGYSEYSGVIKRDGVIYSEGADITSTKLLGNTRNGATCTRGTLTWSPTTYIAKD